MHTSLKLNSTALKRKCIIYRDFNILHMKLVNLSKCTVSLLKYIFNAKERVQTQFKFFLNGRRMYIL